MGRPRRHNTNQSVSSSEASSVSLSDNDGSYDPGSETDLTELDCPPSPPAQNTYKNGRSKCYPKVPQQQSMLQASKNRGMLIVATKQVHQTPFADPADDTDEDLSKVPEDYGKPENTKKLRLRLKDRWTRYCRTKATESQADLKWDDVEEALRQASPNDMHKFLNWCLKLQYNSDGRRVRGFTKFSALEEDWKYFRVYYTTTCEHKMSKEMSEAVRTGMLHLADKYNLDKQPRENCPVYIEDMVPFNETILQTREKRFHLGIQRIILCLYNTIGMFTVNRKYAMLTLQYKHLQITLQQDPRGGPPIPMIELRPEFVKGCLGMSKLNTFTLPEIVYGVSLVFSPHVLLFGILFYIQAFEAPHLTSMENLRRLIIEDGRLQMELPLKREMDNYYVFPKVEAVDGKPSILWETPMGSNTVPAQLASLSEIHGFLNHFFTHQFRYGGGKLLDDSGFISEAQRNVIMNHANSRAFLKHYRIRRHGGLQEIMCGLDPDIEFARAMERMSRWIDKRRPRYLDDAEKAEVEKDPELQEAKQWRMELQKQCDHSDDPTLLAMLGKQEHHIEKMRKRLREKQRKKKRQEFSRKQAVIDIERQLTGAAVNDGIAQEVLRREFDMPPEHINLVEKLFTWPISDSLENEWKRRNDGVEAVRLYCGFPEGGPLRGRPKRAAPLDDEDQDISPPPPKKKEEPTCSPWDAKLCVIDKHTKTVPKPRACFQCLKKYSDYNGVKRHFKTSHLKDRKCNYCDVTILHEMHLRRHAEEIHQLQT